MYGAFIGDIVGSKYEFNNIKTKNFPLFSEGCDYTDDTIMTVAVARAILLSRARSGGSQKGFQEFLVEQMRDFGRRYPHPTGAYGGRFAAWLRWDDPRPYGSYGNGSAMRVSPCALAAVTLEEALALARASACVTHDHPEGVRGAEAVAAAIFMAKSGESKAEIRQYIREHYYKLDFTLDSIRETYSFDGSCQGSVPQAIVAFLESESFEDAIRNVISIGGDCDTTGAIAGSIAWAYYAVQTGRYDGWISDRFDPSMLEIKARAAAYLPKEFIGIADEFHEVCWRRAETYGRIGGCPPILNPDETKKYGTGRGMPSIGAHYSLDFIRAQGEHFGAFVPGALCAFYQQSTREWCLRIQLDEEGMWFLAVLVREDGSFEKYALYEVAASFSHYEFEEEWRIREALYAPGDERAPFHEILIRYVKAHGGEALRNLIMPYVTAESHFNFDGRLWNI